MECYDMWTSCLCCRHNSGVSLVSWPLKSLQLNGLLNKLRGLTEPKYQSSLSLVLCDGNPQVTEWFSPHKGPGPCITNVFATRRKNISQWHRSFQRKLRSHWLKFLRHVAITLVIQGSVFHDIVMISTDRDPSDATQYVIYTGFELVSSVSADIHEDHGARPSADTVLDGNYLPGLYGKLSLRAITVDRLVAITMSDEITRDARLPLLTYWGGDKLPPFRRRHFQMHFHEWKYM